MSGGGHRLVARALIGPSRPGRCRRAFGPGEEHQAELADLHLVAVGEHRRIDRLAVDVGAVEAADVDDLELAAFQPELGVPRLTVTSSRKMSLSGCRPADVVGWSSRNREPALGPRLTTSSAEPAGRPFDARDRAFGARRGRSVQFVEEVGAENRCRLHGDIFRRLVSPRVLVLFRHPLLLTGCCGDIRPDPPADIRLVSTVPRRWTWLCPPPPDPPLCWYFGLKTLTTRHSVTVAR